jgi:hypothetical protein
MHEKRHAPEPSPEVAASDSDTTSTPAIGGGRHDQ